MTDSPERTDDSGLAETRGPWPWRPPLLALLGLATGIAVHLLIGPDTQADQSPFRLALIVLILVAAAMIGFTISKRFWWASVAFAAGTGLTAAALSFWNGPFAGWSSAEFWRMLSLFLTITIAAPLFQAARDAGRVRFPYVSVHDHAWANVVLWCACWVFVGVVFLLIALLAALFDLIGIGFLADLMRRDWFWRALTGLAFGTCLGMLREHDAVVQLLQRVVATVLSVLAPVLAVGLVLFVVALPFTGLKVLWNATDMGTPILLGCVIGALILLNAVIGNSDGQESRSAAFRWGATALAAVILPLAIIAAIGTGMRIGQYGFTPQRLWAVTFVTVACLYGAAYWWALIRGRIDWAALARRANLALAFAVMAIALLLATPLVSFNAVSAADQLARLESGLVPMDKFDWESLSTRYGQPGRDALAQLEISSNPAFREKAKQIAKGGLTLEMKRVAEIADARELVAQRMRVVPAGTALPTALRDLAAANPACARGKCTMLISGKDALLFEDGCFASRAGVSKNLDDCGVIERFALGEGGWDKARAPQPKSYQKDVRNAGYNEGKIEIRTVERRQAYIGDVPVGEPFE